MSKKIIHHTVQLIGHAAPDSCASTLANRWLASVATVSALSIIAATKCVDRLVRSVIEALEAVVDLRNGPRCWGPAEQAMHLGPAVAPPEVTRDVEPRSAFRSYYDSIGDRDQLARAIVVNGDWGDPEIAHLVRRAATSQTADGYLLCCLLDDGDAFDAPRVASGLTRARRRAETTTPPPSRIANPFGTQGVAPAANSLDVTEVGLAGGLYDPIRMVWITPSLNLTAPNANPFRSAN
jgi:hypothetical protein